MFLLHPGMLLLMMFFSDVPVHDVPSHACHDVPGMGVTDNNVKKLTKY